MDPILLAAIQKLQARQKELGGSVEVTPEHIEEYLRAQTGGKFGYKDYQPMVERGPSNYIRSAMNGATMNLADNVIGMFSKKQADESRVRSEAFKSSHPWDDAAGSIGGAVATGTGVADVLKALPMLSGVRGLGWLAKLTPEANTIGSAALKGAGAGAGYGAVSAAGAADDGTMLDRAKAAGGGAVTGAVAGGLLGGVAGTASSLFSPASRASRRMADAIAKSGGADALRVKAAQLAANGRGDIATLADLSPHLNQAADFAANNSDDALIGIGNVLKGRQVNQAGRLLNDVQETVGGNPDASQRAGLLATERKTWADGPTGYGGLRDANPKFDVTGLSSALNKPVVQSAWKQARLGGDLVENSPLDKMMQKLALANPGQSPSELKSAAQFFTDAAAKDAGSAAEGPRPASFDDLQQFLRTLRGKATAAWKNGNGAAGKSFTTIADHVEGALEEGSPGFKAVNTEYAAHKAGEEALAAGEQAWHANDPRGLATQMAKMTPQNLYEFRYGMASKFVAQLRNAATNRDAAKELLDRSAAMNDKLRVVFGSKEAFGKFLSRLNAEGDLSGLKSAVGGSQTARRLQAAGFDPAEMGIDAMIHPGAAGAGLLRAAAHTAKGALARGTARQMTGPLLTQGASNIDAFLAQLATPRPLVGAQGTIAAPMGLMTLNRH